jgi:hypothetical protein
LGGRHHFGFKTLAKHGFPTVSVFFPPNTVSLPHLPIGADHCMSATINVAAAKLIPEIEGYLFERSDPYRYFLARRPWTVDEQKKLDDLMEAGKTAAEIATAQRTPPSIYSRLQRLYRKRPKPSAAWSRRAER